MKSTGTSPAGPADPDAVFAARSDRRPRWAAIGAAGVALVGVAFVGCLLAAGVLGPDAPGVDLPAFERYDIATTSNGPALPSSRHGTVIAVGGFGVAMALGAWWWSRRSSGVSVPRRVRRISARIGRWWVIATITTLIAMVVAMSAHAYTANAIASDEHVSDGFPALTPGTGSVIDIGERDVRSAHPRPGHVALTFDDGPNPRWTPQILDLLRREHVPATFFVIGEHVVAHPGLVRRALREGSEVGVHTYRHLEISAQSEEDFRRDLRLTQLAIVGATGRGTSLFRPPFITDWSNVGLRQYVNLANAGRSGYVTVLADRDSTDWSNPGTGVIALRSMPGNGAGAIIEMHDGGGNRAQTVEALGIVIRALKDQGYVFETVSDIARLPASTRMPTRGVFEQLWGRAFIRAVSVTDIGVPWLGLLVLFIALITIMRMAVVAAGGIAYEREARRRSRIASPAPTMPPGDAEAREPPSVSLLIAAYTEEQAISATLTAACAAAGPEVQIVVVDDGSPDGTAAMVSAFPDRRVQLVSIVHAGKAEALAAGLEVCTGDIIVTVDADTTLRPGTLDALVSSFADDALGAVSGNLRVAQPDGVLGAAQRLEYCVGNAFDRRALDRCGIQLTVPGAAGAYRRAALEAVGGFDGATVAEDTDLTLAIVDAGWRVGFVPEAIADTSTPATVEALWRQRSRWSFGIAQALWRRRSMAAHPRQRPRAAGTWAFGALTQVLIPIAAPLLDIAALWAIFSGADLPIVLWLIVAVLQVVAAAVALRIERQPLRYLWVMPVQLFGYRQITSFVVLQAAAWAVAGRRAGWGTRRRTLVAAPTAPAADALDPTEPVTPSLPVVERAA